MAPQGMGGSRCCPPPPKNQPTVGWVFITARGVGVPSLCPPLQNMVGWLWVPAHSTPRDLRDPIADTLWDVGVPLLAPHPKTMGRVLITPRDVGIPLLPPFPNTPSGGGASGMTPLS